VEGVLYDAARRRIPEHLIERAYETKYASIVDFYVDYYSPGRFITTTHSNIPVRTPAPPFQRWIARRIEDIAHRPWMRRFRSPEFIRAGEAAVFDDGEFESSLVFYTWREGTSDGQIRLELRNAAGESRYATVPAQPPSTLRRWPIAGLFADSRAFLGGQIGNVLMDRPIPLLETNPRFYVHTARARTPEFGIDHTAMEHLQSRSTPRAAWLRTGKGYHFPSVVLERDDTRSLLAWFNVVAVDRPKRYGVMLYDADGKLVVDKRHAVEIPPRGHALLRVRDLLSEVGYGADFVGHAEVVYTMDVDRYPDAMHHQVLYVQRDMIECVQHGAALWNSPPDWRRPPDVRDPQNHGHWLAIVAAVYIDHEFSTMIGLTNCSHAWDYDVEASITVTLRSGGVVVGARDITIPPHGLWLQAIENLFPDARQALRPLGGAGVVTLRPNNVLTMGAQLFHVVRATGQFSSEHTL
jgi:hypothetical protein